MVAALALGLAACGGAGNDADETTDGGPTGSTALTIYSSLPLQGDAQAQSEAINNGEQMALDDAGGRVGRFTVALKKLDDASADVGRWDPGVTGGNARKAAQDRSTIAYLGELSSGASAISVPILNEAGILQISPASTSVGLTQSQNADKGEPEKYYPSGKRTFGRVVPSDRIQAAAQVTYQLSSGCTRLYLLDDQEVYGRALVNQVLPRAKTAGLIIAGSDVTDPKSANYEALAETLRAKRPDCVFFGGSTQSNAVQLFDDLNAAMPTVKLFGGDGVANTAFTSKLAPAAARMTYLTSPTLSPRLYPKAGQRFFRDYRAKYGSDPEPYAIFGYEAMGAALQAIKDAGEQGDDRDAVIDSFFHIKNRKSVLGKYSIDANGDTSLSDYGAYRVQGGRLAFAKAIVIKG